MQSGIKQEHHNYTPEEKALLAKWGEEEKTIREIMALVEKHFAPPVPTQKTLLNYMHRHKIKYKRVRSKTEKPTTEMRAWFFCNKEYYNTSRQLALAFNQQFKTHWTSRKILSLDEAPKATGNFREEWDKLTAPYRARGITATPPALAVAIHALQRLPAGLRREIQRTLRE